MKYMLMTYATAASQEAIDDALMAEVDARWPDARLCAMEVRPIIDEVRA